MRIIAAEWRLTKENKKSNEEKMMKENEKCCGSGVPLMRWSESRSKHYTYGIEKA